MKGCSLIMAHDESLTFIALSCIKGYSKLLIINVMYVKNAELRPFCGSVRDFGKWQTVGPEILLDIIFTLFL